MRLAAAVFHVGRLPGVPLGAAGREGPIPALTGTRGESQEGPGLSVSRSPAAWTRIAQLGGLPWYALRRADGQPGRFLDVAALRHRRVDCLADAQRLGFVARGEAVRVEHYDDEFEETTYSDFPTLAEALPEAALEDVLEDLPQATAAQRALVEAVRAYADGETDEAALAGALQETLDRARATLARGSHEALLLGAPRARSARARRADARRRVLLVPVWVAAPRLHAWWGETFTTPLHPMFVEDVALAALVHEATALDGLWWDAPCDPDRLRAPRAVILPRALGAWVAREATDADLDALMETGEDEE